MRLFSAAQQRRVYVVTCTLVFKHKATSKEGVMNFHLCFLAFSNSFIPDCNSLLLTIQFSDTLTPEVQNAIHQLLLVVLQIQFPDRVVEVPVVIVCVTEGVVGESSLCVSIRSSSFSFDRC